MASKKRHCDIASTFANRCHPTTVGRIEATLLADRIERSRWRVDGALIAGDYMPVPAHWTYDDFKEGDDLSQGDIVEPTDELRLILRDVFPHFLDGKYVSFMVISQSCDLVRREGYRGQPINLCVVREVGSILLRLLQRFCGSDIPGIFLKEQKHKGKMFLERTINQNEQAIGLFYLHPDADAGISTPSVAMLRISIALHAKHYDVICKSRRGRLKADFQAKLGWLVGNLYSRVATPDWSEPKDRKRQQDAIVNDTLSQLVGVHWMSSAAITAARKKKWSTVGKTTEEIASDIRSLEPTPLSQQFLSELKRIMAKSDLRLPEEFRDTLLKIIPSDAAIAEIFRKMDRM